MPVDPNELLSRAQKNDAAGIQTLVNKGLSPRYREMLGKTKQFDFYGVYSKFIPF
jgi:hypothetical protein